MTHIIYKITNQINNKIYIGRSRLGVKARWKAHISRLKAGYYNHLRLYRALLKHGSENFIIEQIETCPDFETAQRREGETILLLKSYLPEVGYNMALDTGRGLEFLSEESMQRRRTNIRIRSFTKKTSSSSFVGVSLPHKGSKSWRTHLNVNGKRASYSFATPEEAAAFFDLSSIYSYGADTPLNYEDRRQEYLAMDLEKELSKITTIKIATRTYPKKSNYLGITFHNKHQKWAFSVYNTATEARHTETVFESEEDAYEAQQECIELNPDYVVAKPRKPISP